jgi:ribose 5-phosphate isomerase
VQILEAEDLTNEIEEIAGVVEIGHFRRMSHNVTHFRMFTDLS